MHLMISEKRDLLIDACKRFDVARLDIFGSAARGSDFDPARSDVVFLVLFRPDAKADFYFDLEEELVAEIETGLNSGPAEPLEMDEIKEFGRRESNSKTTKPQ